MDKKYYKATEAYFTGRGLKQRWFLGCVFDVKTGRNTDVFTDGEGVGGSKDVIIRLVKDGWLEEIPKQEAALLFGRV